MSAIPAERLPWLAGAGLACCVFIVALLPLLRDPAGIATIEGSPAAPESDDARQSEGRSARAGASSSAEAERSTSDKPAATATKLEVDASITEAQVDRASTLSDIKALAERAPKDERVLKKLARLQSTSSEADGLRDALITLKTLFGGNPKLSSDKELQAIVLKAAASTSAAAQDLAFEIMTSRMGTAGPDLLYELTLAAGTPAVVKQRALAQTKLEEVKKLASNGLKVALELRDRSPCERKALLEDVLKHGDKRSLQYLTPMQKKKGCGVFSLGDCYECFGDRAELARAIAAASAR